MSNEETMANRPALVGMEQPYTMLSRLQQHRLYLQTELEKTNHVLARLEENEQAAEILTEIYQISGLFHQ